MGAKAPFAMKKTIIGNATLYLGNCLDVLKKIPDSSVDSVVQQGRKFIGIEREPKYFDIAVKRIEQAVAQGQLLPPEPVAAPEQQAMEL